MSASHRAALAQALFVTALWSSSWVLIAVGLRTLPPLTFAGLRYGLAFLCLLPLILIPARLVEIKALDRRDWLLLVGFGLLQYGLTQAAQFISISLLPAASASLMLAFTPALVALASGALLGERLTWPQWLGVAAFLCGAGLYFGLEAMPEGQMLGLAVAAGGLAFNAGQTLMGRWINRTAHIRPTLVTTISMGVGAACLLTAGLATAPFPSLTVSDWGLLAWLAVINTAVAFTLWNHTQRSLSATQSSLINNTMLIQIAILAWIFLGQALDARQIVGLAVAASGVLAVQLLGRRS